MLTSLQTVGLWLRQARRMMKWIHLEMTTPLPLELVQILVAHSQPYDGPLAVLQWSAYVES